MSSFKSKAPLTTGMALIVLTTIYFVIELIINTSVYGQLSGSSDMLIAEAMEFWGKIIAGLGIALIATRYQLTRRLKRDLQNSSMQVYKTFLCSCLVAIPLSFILQESVIYYVVSQSSDEDRNKAVLISGTHNTVVPFYVPQKHQDWHDLNALDKLVYPASRFMTLRGYNYWHAKQDNIQSRISCSAASAQALGVVSDSDKVFFQYKAILTGVDEGQYRQVIKEHHLCAFEDDRYLSSMTDGNLNQKDLIIKAYDDLYNPAVNEYMKYKDYKGAVSTAKKVADEKWRTEMDAQYGFKTTIKPMAMSPVNDSDRQGRYYFYDHPDTKRYYADKTGITDVYPMDEDFSEKAKSYIKKNLPDQMIPAYISTTGERSEPSKKLTDEQIAEYGEKAYKAIVMPMVALGLSGFFLILNIILVINAVFERFVVRDVLASDPLLHRLVSKSFLAVALAWFIVWPLTQSGEAYSAFEGVKFESASKWLYYHENNLIPVYNVGYKVLTKGYNVISQVVQTSK